MDFQGRIRKPLLVALGMAVALALSAASAVPAFRASRAPIRELKLAEDATSVALSENGTTALAGDTHYNRGGSAWVLTRSGATWSRQALLTPNPGEEARLEGGWGTTVALSGDGSTAMIGNPRYGWGTVAVFTRTGSAWHEQQPIYNPEGHATVWFGTTLALSGDGKTALIGGSFDSEVYTNEKIGNTYVYVLEGSRWKLQATLPPKIAAIPSVALSSDGNTAILGVGEDEGEGERNGAAYVFTRTGSTWKQQEPTLHGHPGEGFGESVALSGDGNTVLVGAPRANHDTGAVWSFTRTGSSWSGAGTELTAREESGQNQFGHSLALSAAGTRALIGSARFEERESEPITGEAWAFKRQGASWSEQGRPITCTGARCGKRFGESVALSADARRAFISVQLPRPNVTGISPEFGPRSGGTTVTLTGSHFAETTSVEFAGHEVPFTINSDSSITTVSPPGGHGAWDFVIVYNAAGEGSAFFNYPPVVEDISPSRGAEAGGTEVTITGEGLYQRSPENTTVKFGSVEATKLRFPSENTITAVAPPGTGTVDVTVATLGGTSPTIAADQFTYVPRPTVTGVGPSEGPLAGVTKVTIAGSGFSEASAVMFGSKPADGFEVNSDGSITAFTPAGMGSETVDVAVKATGGTSTTTAADEFSYRLPPTVTKLEPRAGSQGGGTTVTITGAGFSNASRVMFGSTSATSFHVDSDTSITAISPPGKRSVNVTVTTLGGMSTTSEADLFRYKKGT